MRLRHVSLLAAVSLAFAASTARATELWDPAPELKIAEWVKGGPADLKKGKNQNVYVVEFWATWCGPCRESIPHLTEMQKKFKDQHVVFVGISDEDTDTVKPFVKKMAGKMDYVVAVDDDHATNKAYMKAFKQDGIPCAFVIDKPGRIVWVGHPMDGLEEVVEKVVAGKFDKKASMELQEQREKRQRNMMKLQTKAQSYMEMIADEDCNENKARKLGNELLELFGDNAMALNSISWTILTQKKVHFRDKDLALRMGKAAYEATKGKQAAVIDTYARALYDNGKKDAAIKLQTEAIKIAEDARMKKELTNTLQLYKAGKPGKMEGAGGDDDDDDKADAGDKKNAHKNGDTDKDDDD